FEDHADYADAVEDFLKNGTHAPPQPKPIEIPVGPKASQAARKVREQLKGSIYGAVGPRSMQMWNKISEADFLRVFGIAREGFDGLRLLNNKLRPESDGTTLVAATEADDGAALTMQVLKLLSGGEPVGFNDLRYWDPREGLYWFVNSGALAPYFAEGRHDSLRGSWS